MNLEICAQKRELFKIRKIIEMKVCIDTGNSTNILDTGYKSPISIDRSTLVPYC